MVSPIRSCAYESSIYQIRIQRETSSDQRPNYRPPTSLARVLFIRYQRKYTLLEKVRSVGNRDTKKSVMLICSTAYPSYCPSALLPIRPTATSDIRQLFIFVLFEGQVRSRQFLCRALRLERARGPSAAARTGQGAGCCDQKFIQQAFGKFKDRDAIPRKSPFRGCLTYSRHVPQHVQDFFIYKRIKF